MTKGAPKAATVVPTVNCKLSESAALLTDLMLRSLVSSIYKHKNENSNACHTAWHTYNKNCKY